MLHALCVCRVLQSHKANYAMPVEIATSSRVDPIKPIYNVPAEAGGARHTLYVHHSRLHKTVLLPSRMHAILPMIVFCLRTSRTHRPDLLQRSDDPRNGARDMYIASDQRMYARLTRVCVFLPCSSHGQTPTQSAEA